MKLNLTNTVAVVVLLLSGLSVQAQLKVGDNPTTMNASAVLEVESVNKGLLLPRIGLTSTSSASPLAAHVAGMVIFNTASAGDVTPGFYYNDGSKWVKLTPNNTDASNNVISGDPVNTQCLGSIPTSTATASTAPATFSYGGFVFNKLGSYNYSGNGHSYALYANQAATVINWFVAKDAAASLGGYLATFTRYQEWKNFHANALAPNSAVDNIYFWMGMARYGYGTGWFQDNIAWITCEQPERYYSVGSSARVALYNNFRSTEPNNYQSGEGFIHTMGKANTAISTPWGAGTTHAWNDFAADGNGGASGTVTGFIVEFQQ